MAGIYIHIPFCKQACYYCDFHFSTSNKMFERMVKNIRKELVLRKNFLSGDAVNTIYFGGGTPSILPSNDIYDILEDINKLFPVIHKPEITLEANPDDLTETKLGELKSAGITRLSIGVQSFDNEILKILNRVHEADTALKSIDQARKTGFDNINIDLIYGINPLYFPVLRKDMAIIKSLLPEHLSAYCLTIEPGTVFGKWDKIGKFHKCGDEEAASEYEFIMEELGKMGYDHYEISNFARVGFLSEHNTSYWLNKKYLGIGPSAHSFDQINRYSNISNNALYNKSIENNTIPETVDYLTLKDRINEYIMTSLRTKWGCDLDYLKSNFGFITIPAIRDYLHLLTENGYVILKGGIIQLTRSGKLIADKIASEMFIP
jgi:oxygen-independent coproporphyrinogen-3 oxidase